MEQDGREEGTRRTDDGASDERYRLLSESSFEGIVLHSDGIIVDANERITEIAGYTREDLVGTNFFELLDPAYHQLVKERVGSDDPRPYEIRARAKDGTMLDLEVQGKVLPHKGSTVRVAAVRDIRGRREAEEALRRSEERYRLLAENLHDVIWTMDLDLRFTYVSPSIEGQRGFRPEDIVGRGLEGVMTPTSLDRASRVVAEVLDPILAGEGDPTATVTLELDLYRKDGSTLLTETTISLILDAEERPIGILGVTRDISDRRAVEAAMEQSEERYRLLAENVEDIIFTIGNDLTFNYVSPSFTRLTGYSFEELVSMGWQGLFSPETLETIMGYITDDAFGMMEHGKPRERDSLMLEAPLLRKDGGTSWVEVNVSTILDEAGDIKEILGVARDMTSRREAAMALERSEERYRLLAENAADIIFILGPDMDFEYVSPSFERLTGYTVEELRSIGWQGILTPESMRVARSLLEERLIESMREGTAPQESVILEMEYVAKDGARSWSEVNISLIHGEDGQVRGVLGVSRDVTERKASQERFMEEKRRAELYLDLFGHDIRNINQGIMSYLELILMRPGLSPEEADYLRSVLEQATRINDLVAKVQRLTQLRARPIRAEDVDAMPLVHAAIDYVVAKYPERDVRINTSSECRDHVVRGSRMLTDVFISILDNAVRFNRNETVEVGIHCHPSKDGGSVQFAFDDRGPGVVDEMKDKVFMRLEQPEGEAKGSGLGLTVVWEIVRQLGGRVWVEDRVLGDPSRGSRFVVELPHGLGAITE